MSRPASPKLLFWHNTGSGPTSSVNVLFVLFTSAIALCRYPVSIPTCPGPNKNFLLFLEVQKNCGTNTNCPSVL
ncbi:hypothetical protein D9C73_018404 [Collichthys lucidus]|uniref:Uncharacterized protein n=1 Tax=Collichthys lucidus TaxID=240159 RepID=A0A4U5VAJ2_COLLU|nr:hypothetical protein D9C73_018404 [Collichthys lucidus]